MVAKCSINSLQVTELSSAQLEDIFAIEIAANKFPWTKAIIKQGLLAGYKFIGVILQNKLIAYGTLELASSDVQLLNLCVLPKYQTQGIGRLLLQYIIKTSTANKILLEVRVSNKKAIKLYKSAGFKKIDIRKKYYRSHKQNKEDAYVFELLLGENTV